MAFASPDEVLSILLDVDVKGLQQFDSNMGKWSNALNAGMGAAKAFIGTLAALDIAIVGFGAVASQKAAQFDSLVISLNAVEGSASKAQRAIASLRDIAKGPGLGVESAIETYAGLRRGGLESGFAMDFTRNLGNAIAYTGGGKEELSRIAIALNQIAISPTLKGQDVMQLAQARLPVYGALKSAFGTGDTAELDKMGVSSSEALRAINAELAKLPKVAGSAKNTFENLADAIDYGMIQIGTGINRSLMPVVNDFLAQLDKINEDGTLESYGSALGDAFIGVLEAFTGESEANGILTEIQRSTLVVAYATTNLVENSRGMLDWLRRVWENIAGKEQPSITVEEWKRRNPGKSFTEMPNPYFKDGQMVVDDPTGTLFNPATSPFEQAEAKMKEIEAEAGRRRQGRESGRLGRDKNGNLVRMIEVEPGVYIPESEATPEQRTASRALKAGRAGAVGGGMPDDPGPEPPATKFLREIERHTRELKESIQEVVMGGGVATDAAFNTRNIGQWSGSSGGSKFARMINDGIQGLIIESGIGMARAGTIKRGP